MVPTALTSAGSPLGDFRTRYQELVRVPLQSGVCVSSADTTVDTVDEQLVTIIIAMLSCCQTKPTKVIMRQRKHQLS